MAISGLASQPATTYKGTTARRRARPATRVPDAESLQLIEQLRILGSDGKWQEVLELTYAQPRVDLLVYEAALVAIAPHGRWQEALQLLLRTRQSSQNCSSCMFACMSGGQPDQALAVFDSMRSRGLKPGPYAFSVAISICVQDRQLQRAASLVCVAIAARCRLDATLVEGVLSACAQEGAWPDIESIWATMLKVSTLAYTTSFHMKVLSYMSCASSAQR
jgi:pentatricopeptide repeat protein